MRAIGVGLRETRSRLDLTQAQAAQLLATSQANISAYERGRLVPGRIVAERIDALAALRPESRYATHLASTIPNAAAQLPCGGSSEASKIHHPVGSLATHPIQALSKITVMEHSR